MNDSSQRPRTRPAVGAAFLIALGLLLGLVGGCSGGASTLRLVSMDNGSVLEPDWRTSVYRKVDSNTADIFLSDVSEDGLLERLAQGAQGEPANLLHIRLFIMPKAGYTPIDYTASNCTITQVVFTGEALGVYGGGGFLLPDQSKLGRAWLDGEIQGATMRLMRADPGFVDRLGQTELSGTLAAKKDGQFVQRIAAEMARLLQE